MRLRSRLSLDHKVASLLSLDEVKRQTERHEGSKIGLSVLYGFLRDNHSVVTG